ncbi:MAG: membrane protein of unknown function [Nitrospira sp.]|nr:hypothetical protein [Nitrospira sp.]ULA61519.1 MAG: membrane protein of unknown function [Nitrospira sp.]
MARLFRFWLRPEGLWLVISLAVYVAATMNQPSPPAGNDLLETLWVAIPLVGIPFTFITAYFRRGGEWWRLAHAMVTSCIGATVASFMATSGVTTTIPENSALMAAFLSSHDLAPAAASPHHSRWPALEQAARNVDPLAL